MPAGLIGICAGKVVVGAKVVEDEKVVEDDKVVLLGWVLNSSAGS